jgi:hypothetical protein
MSVELVPRPGHASLASVGSEIPMSELYDGIALGDDAES